jgi:uncharacterized protein
MKRISEKEAVNLLKKYASNEGNFKGVLGHSKVVQKVALEIGKDIEGVDLDFIKSASLLHDIGRFEYGPGSKDAVKHGIAGAAILRKEGLSLYALVAERHLGAGITKEDIKEQKIDIPLKDYLPVSKEEKIITYADKLVFEEDIKDVEEAISKFTKRFGKMAGERIRKLGEETDGMRED